MQRPHVAVLAASAVYYVHHNNHYVAADRVFALTIYITQLIRGIQMQTLVEQIQHALAAQDWNWRHSDDYTVYTAGQENLTKIHNIREKARAQGGDIERDVEAQYAAAIVRRDTAKRF